MVDTKAPDRTDLVLLLLLAPDKRGRPAPPLRGITRLEKLLFLLKRETGFGKKVEDYFEFEAYRFGPFSKQVYEVVDFLSNLQLIEAREEALDDVFDKEETAVINEQLDENPYRPTVPGMPAPAREAVKERVFELTDHGRRLAERLRERLSDEDWNALVALKQKYGGTSLRSLLTYVYRAYPQSASKSELKDLF